MNYLRRHVIFEKRIQSNRLPFSHTLIYHRLTNGVASSCKINCHNYYLFFYVQNNCVMMLVIKVHVKISRKSTKISQQMVEHLVSLGDMLSCYLALISFQSRRQCPWKWHLLWYFYDIYNETILHDKRYSKNNKIN